MNTTASHSERLCTNWEEKHGTVLHQTTPLDGTISTDAPYWVVEEPTSTVSTRVCRLLFIFSADSFEKQQVLMKEGVGKQHCLKINCPKIEYIVRRTFVKAPLDRLEIMAPNRLTDSNDLPFIPPSWYPIMRCIQAWFPAKAIQPTWESGKVELRHPTAMSTSYVICTRRASECSHYWS